MNCYWKFLLYFKTFHFFWVFNFLLCIPSICSFFHSKLIPLFPLFHFFRFVSILLFNPISSLSSIPLANLLPILISYVFSLTPKPYPYSLLSYFTLILPSLQPIPLLLFLTSLQPIPSLQSLTLLSSSEAVSIWQIWKLCLTKTLFWWSWAWTWRGHCQTLHSKILGKKRAHGRAYNAVQWFLP